MEREHDTRYDDRETDRGGRGYPPAGRGRYRGGRSPGRYSGYRPRRGSRTPPPAPDIRVRPSPDLLPVGSIDTRYNDNMRNHSPRRRSRSPPIRERAGGDQQPYRNRARSPPRDERRRSPGGYGRPRSPPDQPAHDERETQTGGYRQYYQAGNRYGGTPEDDSKRFPRDGGYRGRVRSRSPRTSSHPSHGDTPGSSRRSSPRGYNDRPRGGRYDQGSGRPSPRYAAREHSPRRGASPGGRSPPRRGHSPPPKSPRDNTGWQRGRDGPPPERDSDYPPRDRGFPPQSREAPYISQTSRTWRKPDGPGPEPTRDDLPSPNNPPPAYGEHSMRSPPTGPPASQRPDMSSAPTQPRGRGGPPPYGRDSRDGRDPRDGRDYRDSREPRDVPPYGGGRGRGGYGGPPTPGGRAPSYDSRGGRPPNHYDGYGPPVSSPSRDYGPPPRERERDRDRGSVDGGGRGGGGGGGGFGAPAYPPPFRSNNSSSATYPQTRFFNNAGPRNKQGQQHPLGNLEKMVEGGKKAASALEPAQEKRLQQLEEESRKLQEQIEEKERVKRKSLREWESAERESRRDGLKSELAEGHLERLGGEGAGGSGY